MSDTQHTFTVSPISGGKLERDNYTITATDTSKNYGRNDRVQTKTITTYGDAERTDLKKTTTFTVRHKASTRRIFNIAVKSSVPTTANFNAITKSVPANSANPQQQQTVATGSVDNAKYFIYGITNGSSIVCSNNAGSSASLVSDSFMVCTTSSGTFENGYMNGMTLSLKSSNPDQRSYGTLDVYYFYFQVNTGGNATDIYVVSESDSVTSNKYQITTTASGQISVSPASYTGLAALQTSSPGTITFENTTSSPSALIEKTGTFFDVLSGGNTIVGTQVSARGTVSGDLIVNSNYNIGQNGYLQGVTAIARSGKINIGTTECTISQLQGNIHHRTLTINGGNGILLQKEQGGVSEVVTVPYVSQAYLSNDDQTGVPVRLFKDGTPPGNLNVTINNNNTISVYATETTSQSPHGTPYQVNFKNVTDAGVDFGDSIFSGYVTLEVVVDEHEIISQSPRFTVSACSIGSGNDITFTIICTNEDAAVAANTFNLGLSNYVTSLTTVNQCSFTLSRTGGDEHTISGKFECDGIWHSGEPGEGGYMTVTGSIQGTSIATGVPYNITPSSISSNEYDLIPAQNINIDGGGH